MGECTAEEAARAHQHGGVRLLLHRGRDVAADVQQVLHGMYL